MDSAEIQKLVALEDRHWWYRERRALLARHLRRLPGPPGRALDIGAAGGGNTRVLQQHGWKPIAVEYGHDGATAAKQRKLPTVRGDGRRIPIKSGSIDLVLAFDVLEHIDDDERVAAEINRVLRPGGSALITVPCDMKLWSAHDVAVGHLRRYTRDTLRTAVENGGLHIERLWSWNVLLRPAAATVRKRSTSSDLRKMNPIVNAALSAVIVSERYLPVQSLPGVSLMVQAVRGK
ncbi:class I SAM-dependent methyltransferase [Paractinoplanes lichenicola]|uniref:Class I SAM-dependent methyltransferase n=1 Tax=Paractinoplanes lichenicola TaxID=2802976 RepID=A0ABS1W4H0_9ACTN|nr:class I SAM-dependent methyltransferase [Actinoplanes lichenicola]MBL7261635.1 class I SAM-dependent methyltransferase [Actinoplanes lichenicola]